MIFFRSSLFFVFRYNLNFAHPQKVLPWQHCPWHARGRPPITSPCYTLSNSTLHVTSHQKFFKEMAFSRYSNLQHMNSNLRSKNHLFMLLSFLFNFYHMSKLHCFKSIYKLQFICFMETELGLGELSFRQIAIVILSYSI